jgi:hypothetical protein
MTESLLVWGLDKDLELVDRRAFIPRLVQTALGSALGLSAIIREAVEMLRSLLLSAMSQRLQATTG